MRKLLSRGSVRALKRILMQRFGARVSQRALITKTVPLVGALIGGAWNYGEVTLLRARCVRYFAEQDLQSLHDQSREPSVQEEHEDDPNHSN